MTKYNEMSTVERAAVIRKHFRATPGLKKLSVKKGRGTAGSWLDVSGSGEWGCFTEPERAALEKLGWARNYTGSNGFGIAPEETAYWAERLASGNTGFEVHQVNYDDDGMTCTGWRLRDTRGTENDIKHQGADPARVMAVAKSAPGQPVAVGKVAVLYQDYGNPVAPAETITAEQVMEFYAAIDNTAEEVAMEEEAPFKVQPVAIHIDRWEGWYDREPKVVLKGEGLWQLSDAILWAWAATAPSEGGYDKCKYKVVYEDGETYEGRFDLVAQDAGKKNLLARSMWRHVAFIVGKYQPPHLAAEEYQARVQSYRDTLGPAGMMEHEQFLEKYDLGEE